MKNCHTSQMSFDVLPEWVVLTDAGTRYECIYAEFSRFVDAVALSKTSRRLDVMRRGPGGHLTTEY